MQYTRGGPRIWIQNYVWIENEVTTTRDKLKGDYWVYKYSMNIHAGIYVACDRYGRYEQFLPPLKFVGFLNTLILVGSWLKIDTDFECPEIEIDLWIQQQKFFLFF